MEQAAKDIAAGFISGWTQVLIMQPFEIVKIRLQTQTPGNAYYNGMVDCFKKIAKEEGPAAFYKGKISFYLGTVSPLIGIGFMASAMFFTYQACKRYFNQFKKNVNDRLPLQFIAASAAVASLPTALIAVLSYFNIRVLFNMQESESKFKRKVLLKCTMVQLTLLFLSSKIME